MTNNSIVCHRLNLKIEARCELHRSHQTDRILAEPKVRISDHANQSASKIIEAADVVDHRKVGDVVEESVDREIPASGILERGSERIVVGHEQIFLGRSRVRLAAEGRHFDDPILKDHVDEAKAASDDPAIAKQPPDLHRMRVCGDIEVLGRALHEEVTNASPAQVRLVPAAVETIEDLENVLGDISAGDAVSRTVNHSGFGVRSDGRRRVGWSDR